MLFSRRIAAAIYPRAFLSSAPSGTRFVKTHEWVHVSNGVGTIGITHFAQEQLGDLVYVELPSVGAHLNKGDSFGCVESVKSSSDVYAPVSGEVVEVNDVLNQDPAKINEEPYGVGWMVKIKVDNASEAEALLSQEEYDKITNA